ncbi:hypothetical protein ACLM5H_03495 [Fredinandcohnia humi]
MVVNELENHYQFYIDRKIESFYYLIVNENHYQVIGGYINED